jgi:GNAT superfamily N-acetyltransferase
VGSRSDDEVTVRRWGRPGDLGWVVGAHGELYAGECGWNCDFEALVARIVADHVTQRDPAREAGWITERGGRRVGCVLCVAGEPDTAVLRILLVDPSARGLGVGGLLVGTCLDFARAVGYLRMRLWTNDVLTAARRLYLAAGFRLVDEQPHHSFGADLVGQTYELDLRASTGAAPLTSPAAAVSPAAPRAGSPRADRPASA